MKAAHLSLLALVTATVLVLGACSAGPDSDASSPETSSPDASQQGNSQQESSESGKGDENTEDGESDEGTESDESSGSDGNSDENTDESGTVTSGLEAPWSIAFYGATPLISERDSARILEIDEHGESREVAVIDGVQAGGEGGLLGIAVQDDFLYTYFTGQNDNRIVRHQLSGESGSLALGSAEILLEGIPAAGNHNGGRIAFGPDGMLYATTGDASNSELSQQFDSLAGKILRMTPDGEIPEDNPFEESYVYSYGHRNPQGIAWDDNGTMYSSEFGQKTWDELNIIEAGGNYGWPTVEGIAETEGFIDPVQQWQPSEASPSGIAIFGGCIWIANLRGERLREVPLNDLSKANEYWTDTSAEGGQGRLRDAVHTPDGQLWILTNNTDGRGDPGLEDDRIIQVNLPKS